MLASPTTKAVSRSPSASGIVRSTNNPAMAPDHVAEPMAGAAGFVPVALPTEIIS